MDIRICALLLLLAVVGTHGDFNGYPRLRRIIEGSAGHEVVQRGPIRIAKRAADVKGDTKNKEDPKDDPTTATGAPSTPRSIDPSTGSTPRTEAPKTTSKPNEATTKPSSEKPQLGSRSGFEDNKEQDPSSKPTNAKKPEPLGASRSKPSSPNTRSPPPSIGAAPTGSNPGSGYQPYGNYPFPGYNSIPSYGPNYAFTSTNQGPDGSASSSASSFAGSGGYSGQPSFPTFNSRGGFYDNTPYYNPNAYNPGNAWSASPKKPMNDVNQDKPLTSSRSNFDTDDKPGNNAGPGQNPNSLPSNGPQNIPGHGFGGPYTPNFGYPAANSVQGPNYAWTNSGPGYSGAAAGAFTGSSGTPTFSSRGGFADNNAAPGYPDNSAYVPGAVGNGFAFPEPGFGLPFNDNFAFHQRLMEDHFRTIQAQIEAHQRAMQGLGNLGPGSSDPGVHSAISSISLGPRGGFQAGEINPVGPGIESRFAEELPAPSGGPVGVFASSSSSSMTGPDGKTISHKSSTTGVNDNGKITFRTVQD